LFGVLISLHPRITGMKIENAWGRGSRGMVRCTARLSRPLRARECHFLEGLPDTTVADNVIVHECRPEEVEDWNALVADALRGEWVAPARILAQAVGPKPRRERKRSRLDPTA
jgi:hypothetical protein